MLLTISVVSHMQRESSLNYLVILDVVREVSFQKPKRSQILVRSHKCQDEGLFE
jgi:hypothetical protein